MPMQNAATCETGEVEHREGWFGRPPRMAMLVSVARPPWCPRHVEPAVPIRQCGEGGEPPTSITVLTQDGSTTVLTMLLVTVRTSGKGLGPERWGPTRAAPAKTARPRPLNGLCLASPSCSKGDLGTAKWESSHRGLPGWGRGAVRAASWT